ncbi:LysM peptidoglycan-binding domain-containing protein [Saccharopolyspora sp. K220]|uniref:LysM peptidoglycan-binding domain-containing protein n=1 Tax=Saccharopolyspora soli TaxID=2926618 RepID=UPI001F55BB74|nr:LysM peptidoglycan-binding domain-containing protein [Saccharopolyspora soli]MCI2421861.1 LysM peptidoglycan-binding domain-containing protein [Saccharopolyspora soli]
MTTFIDAAGLARPAEREVAARRPVGDPVAMPRPSGGMRRTSGRIISRGSGVRARQAVAGCGRARRSGEWLWLTSVGIFTFLIVMLVGLFGLGDAPVSGGTAVVEVHAGDTLWEIAGRVAPDSDPRAVVARIVELNGLDKTAVEAGRLLLVPSGA